MAWNESSLTSPGLRVFSGSRSVVSMKSLVDLGIEPIQLDPTSPESISAARDEVAKRTGGTLDILVNNA
jgi:1-acylglycerone phosphate reductase